MTGHDLRRLFLEYFKGTSHEIVPSAPLIPGNDPTLLFTNAGMVPFKDLFLGREKRAYSRAASSQKCVRAGGKHNDLEAVGHTARHLTFFEMLGNFSFGDYFKEEAIAFAWEFLTEVVKLPAERLYPTVYKDDDEAFAIWEKEIGVPANRIQRRGEKDNFWAMGDTGPCGPCSEIHYRREVTTHYVGETEEDAADDQLLEVWNLVFMQYERDASGKLTPLPKPSIDTGMGLERLTCVINGHESVWDTDLLRDLIRMGEDLSGKEYGTDPKTDVSLRVLADHARSTAFLLADGVIPSNEGRGYVLRRIMRRALRHGYLLGLHEPFFFKAAGQVVELFGHHYGELLASRNLIAQAVHSEEERFGRALHSGIEKLDHLVEKIKAEGGTELPGEEAFKLYDTFGFPLDLTADIAKDSGLAVEKAGYDRAMHQQAGRARAAQSGYWEFGSAVTIDPSAFKPVWTAYRSGTEESHVMNLFQEGGEGAEVAAGGTAEVLLDATPFYAESGGQVGDTGWLLWQGGWAEVTDCQQTGLFVHTVVVKEGTLTPGMRVTAKVNTARRDLTKKNHTATHLLHWALRSVLGEHVRQQGSLVEPERLRFDFSHFQGVTAAELEKIELMVNERIAANEPVGWEEMPFQDALKRGALAFFGDKYGDVVRVVSAGDASKELCGGTHVERTGDIGAFLIVREEGVAAGVRRIEALTSVGAVQEARRTMGVLQEAAFNLKTQPSEVVERINRLQESLKEREKEIQRLQGQLAAHQVMDPSALAKEIKGVKVITKRIDNVGVEQLRQMGDKLKEQMGSGVIVLGTILQGSVLFISTISKDLTGRIQAGKLVGEVARIAGGGGGGRPDFAQAGGKKPEKLDEALAAVYEIVEKTL